MCSRIWNSQDGAGISLVQLCSSVPPWGWIPLGSVPGVISGVWCSPQPRLCGDVSKATWISASLRSGAGKSLGKSFGTSQQHLPWLSSHLGCSSRWGELPQLLGGVTEGPRNSPGGFQAWAPPEMEQHMAAPSNHSQHGGSTQIHFPWGGKSVGPQVLPGKTQNQERSGADLWGITAGDATGGKLSWEGGKKRKMCL